MERPVEPTKEQFYQRRIAELTQQVATLTEQVARLSKNSSNSSKPPSSDIVKPPKPNLPTGPRKQGGQPGHKGDHRPPFRPDQIEHTEELHPADCPHCHNGDLEPTGQSKIQQVAELREVPLSITEYQLHQSRCRACGRTVWADPPPGVGEGQLFGPRLQSLIAYMKGSLHASYSGLAEFCQEILGIHVARSHLCNTISRVNDALAKSYNELSEHVSAEPILNIDESGWKDKGVKYWIWVFSAATISFFHIARSRGSKVLEEVLGKTYGGTIISDFFSAYIKYANPLQQFCLAHLIRDIKFLTTLPGEADKRFGELLLIEFKRLFHLWHLREKIPRDRFDRIVFRIQDRVLALARSRADDDERSRSRTLARRFVKHGNPIFLFLLDWSVSPTNNAAERCVRTAVIDRRITQGSRSQMGREWNARIWTVLGTCRKQGRSAWHFLQDALSAHHFQTPAPSLLPQTS
ncbi:MAG: IS66 family transposase [Deltaproteobacteria bacterium]|nr:MAG: IS66 family transposase [Deltaproteobacteria bacterium]